MSQVETVRGRGVVVQPDQGASYWQPVPANGHADPKLTPATTGFEALAMGYQTIAPGCRVREHSHGEQVELQICFSGRGRVVVDGATHTTNPRNARFLGYGVKHEIWNEGPGDLVMLWIVSPPGLERFFEAIGRARRPGDAAPEALARPTDVVAIQRALGTRGTRRA